MKIAVDARFYGTEHTGLGRYTTNVMAYLPGFLRSHTLYVLLRQKYFDSLQLPTNCVKVLADFDHYSLSEQLFLPGVIKKTGCDLLYALHFNVPLNVGVPFVATVHDLIKTHFSGPDTTTRNPWLFRIKRLGYDYTISHAVGKACHLIVPTNTVKNDILAAYNADPTIITPIAEAPDAVFRKLTGSAKPGLNAVLPDHYLLYVGNAYPHKNLSLLLTALVDVPNLDLVIVTKMSPFLEKLLSRVPEPVKARITVLENIADNNLAAVYRGAAALVTPSLMEGYGLPGIEALMVGTPVIASDIPVYREVYGQKVTYIDPHSVASLAAAIRRVTSAARIRRPLILKRTWKDVAGDIAEVIDARCTCL